MSLGTWTLASLVLAAGTVPADVVPINQRNFQIPIRIDAGRRHEIRELLLFASTDRGATWNQVATAPPDKDAFVYYAPADGQYWFSVCVVDTRGNREPADIYKTTPGQKVLVDSVQPTVRFTGADRKGDEVAVSWEVRDEAIDLASLRVEYRTLDTPGWSWSAVPASPGVTGQARFRVSSPGAVVVRLQVQDRAGNVGMAQTEVAATGNSSTNPAPAAVANPPVGNPAGLSPAPGFTVPSSPSTVTSMSPGTAPASPWERGQGIQTASLAPADPRAVPDRGWPPLAPAAPSAPSGPNSRVVATTDAAGAVPPPLAAGPSRGLRASSTAAHMTNRRQVSLDYRVDKVGPSGVGSVELWLTQDEGQTWRKFADDGDLISPLTVDLPSEGAYGFTLVVRSRANLGRRPPQPGDLPEMRIEVDTTPPEAFLFEPEPDVQRAGGLLLRWNVTDRALAANPITLHWAERPDGPWQSIGSELPNTGRYVWQLPTSVPARVYLRLVARDMAGNQAVAQTAEPLVVDLSEPVGQLLGIAGSSRRP
jgi:hypothetical protein